MRGMLPVCASLDNDFYKLRGLSVSFQRRLASRKRTLNILFRSWLDMMRACGSYGFITRMEAGGCKPQALG